MGSSTWRALVNVALPPPLLLLAALLLPLPRPARHAVLRVVDRVLTLPVLGTVQLGHLMSALTAAALAGAARDSVAHGRAATVDVSPAVAAANLARRWRAERNAWIGCVAFLAWTLLARVHVLVRRLAALEDAALERARPAAAAFLAGATTARAAGAGAAAAAAPARGASGVSQRAAKKTE